MKLQLAQIDPLLQAHRALDGYQEVVVLNGEKKPVGMAYAFSAKFAWLKVKNLIALKKASAAIDEMRVGIAKEFTPGGGTKVPDANLTAYATKYAAALEQEDELELTPFSKEDLNLFDPKDNPAGNKIPSGTLMELMPLITNA